MRIAAMKIMGGAREYHRVPMDSLPARLVGEGKGLTSPAKLIRYALSLPIHTPTNGVGEYEQLSTNLAVCYEFKLITREEQKDILLAMKNSDKFLAYNKPGYARA